MPKSVQVDDHAHWDGDLPNRMPWGGTGVVPAEAHAKRPVTTRRIALRHCLLPLRPIHFLASSAELCHSSADSGRFGRNGRAMMSEAWNEPEVRTLSLRRASGAEKGSVDAALPSLDVRGVAHGFTLPPSAMDWTIVFDVADPEAEEYCAEGESVPVAAHSVVLLATRLPPP